MSCRALVAGILATDATAELIFDSSPKNDSEAASYDHSLSGYSTGALQAT